MFYCNNLPFSDLGFVAQDENLWVKFTNGSKSVPHFVITTTINPTSLTFLVKDLFETKTISTNSYDKVKEFVLSNDRDHKLKKLLD